MLLLLYTHNMNIVFALKLIDVNATIYGTIFCANRLLYSSKNGKFHGNQSARYTIVAFASQFSSSHALSNSKR